jgi:hypothetical protein
LTEPIIRGAKVISSSLGFFFLRRLGGLLGSSFGRVESSLVASGFSSTTLSFFFGRFRFETDDTLAVCATESSCGCFAAGFERFLRFTLRKLGME